jgi:uncharacterized protein YyaL (SSP411 family)
MTERFLAHYDVRPGGNWEGTPSSTYHVPTKPPGKRWPLRGPGSTKYAPGASPPLRDEKILAAWNGLMISALAVAGRILDAPRYVAAAARAADFVLTHLRGPDGGLRRSFKDGQARQAAFLDDHAFLAAGLIDLYEATFDLRHLRDALALAETTERLFADPAGAWFMSSEEHETLDRARKARLRRRRTVRNLGRPAECAPPRRVSPTTTAGARSPNAACVPMPGYSASGRSP